MKSSTATLAGLTVVLATLVIGAYAFYLRFFVTAPPIIGGGLVTSLVVLATLVVILWLAFGQFHALVKYSAGAETDRLAPTSARKTSYWARSAGILLLIAMFYVRHAQHGWDRSLWVDQYWQFILPVVLVLSALMWLCDTLMAPIINGSHRGRTTLALRPELVLKRVSVLVLAMAFLSLTNIQVPDLIQEAYRNAAASILLIAIDAILISFVVIAR